MSWVAVGVGVGGAVIGGVGSAVAANSAKKSSASEQRFLQEQLTQGMFRRVLTALGPAEARKWAQANLPRQQYEQIFGRAATSASFTPEQQQRLATVNSRITELSRARGSGVLRDGSRQSAEELRALQAEREALMRASGGDPGMEGTFNNAGIDAADRGYVGRLDDLATEYKGIGRETQGQFDSESRRLLGESRGIEAQARGYGEQERRRIDRDYDRSLTSANKASSARLRAAGFAESTLGANQAAANSRYLGEARENALGSLYDRQLQFGTGLRQNTLGLDAQRSGAGTQLAAGIQDRNLNLASNAANVRASALTGADFNPFLSVPTNNLFSGASPGGSFAQSLGGTMAGIGGQMIGNNGWGQTSTGARAPTYNQPLQQPPNLQYQPAAFQYSYGQR
jgi:hypothetical protein